MHPTGSEDNRAAGPTWTPGFSQPAAGMTASAHRKPPASRFVRDQMLHRRAPANSFGRALARKLNLNSLASWSKDEIEKGLNQLYHIRTWPQRVVGKARYIGTSDVSYKGIWARKATTCFKESDESNDKVSDSGWLKGAREASEVPRSGVGYPTSRRLFVQRGPVPCTPHLHGVPIDSTQERERDTHG
ncbi:hypothetical protein BHE74_00007118 [Ensete ventricosum]|nr:hypothetical protein BHE74_00007118 [Ensete ventricosum]